MTTRKPSKFRKWQPQKWDPIYEQFVMYSAFGATNKQIADKFGYTPQQVSNVLSSAMAQTVKEQISYKIRENLIDGIEKDRIGVIAKAHENIKRVLTNDELMEKSPFKMLDASMRYLQGVGEMEGEKKGGDSTTINISSTVVNNLVTAMEKSAEVKELHGK